MHEDVWTVFFRKWEELSLHSPLGFLTFKGTRRFPDSQLALWSWRKTHELVSKILVCDCLLSGSFFKRDNQLCCVFPSPDFPSPDFLYELQRNLPSRQGGTCFAKIIFWSRSPAFWFRSFSLMIKHLQSHKHARVRATELWNVFWIFSAQHKQNSCFSLCVLTLVLFSKHGSTSDPHLGWVQKPNQRSLIKVAQNKTKRTKTFNHWALQRSDARKTKWSDPLTQKEWFVWLDFAFRQVLGRHDIR